MQEERKEQYESALVGDGSKSKPYVNPLRYFKKHTVDSIFQHGTEHWILNKGGKVVRYKPGKYDIYFWRHLNNKRPFRTILKSAGFSEKQCKESHKIAIDVTERLVKVLPELFEFDDELNINDLMRTMKKEFKRSIAEMERLTDDSESSVKDRSLAMEHVKRTGKLLGPLLVQERRLKIASDDEIGKAITKASRGHADATRIEAAHVTRPLPESEEIDL